MCIGEMCTHHLDYAVQWLEQDFDRLDIVERNTHTATEGIHYTYPTREAVAKGVGGAVPSDHRQPMFTIKDDPDPDRPARMYSPDPDGESLARAFDAAEWQLRFFLNAPVRSTQ